MHNPHPRTFLLLKIPPIYYIPPHVQSHSLRAPPWPSPPACCGLVYLPLTIWRRCCFSRRTLSPQDLSTNNMVYNAHWDEARRSSLTNGLYYLSGENRGSDATSRVIRDIKKQGQCVNKLRLADDVDLLEKDRDRLQSS